MQNIFKKYTAGVYCLQSTNKELSHGDTITITTRRGKEVDAIVWKKLKENDEFAYYSYVREDGFCRSEWTKRKLERAEGAAQKQHDLSNDYYKKAQKGRDFLSLGEPIKVGHHSEKRHRKLIDDNWRNMGKSVEASKKQAQYENKAETLEYKLKKEINLDTPESLELLIQKVDNLELQREKLKQSDNYETYQLTNLGQNIRRYKKRLETANKLWNLEHDNSQPTRQELKAKKKEEKQKAVDELLKKCEVIWAFSTEQFEKNRTEGYKYVAIGAGGYLPVQHVETWNREYISLK